MRVAVLAVDPSSPYSGGALLGDRIRMAAHINDPDVLIRSVATRGHLGGLAAAVPAAIRLLAALSYDLIVLETVGVGQSEIEIAAIADPTVVILNPGAGDAVQAAKAGLLEVADIVVVNKADRDGADQTVRDLRAETNAPILKLVAAQGEGIAELVEAIEAHAPSRHSRAPDGTCPRADPVAGADAVAQPSRPGAAGDSGRRGPRRSLHGRGTTRRTCRILSRQIQYPARHLGQLVAQRLAVDVGDQWVHDGDADRARQHRRVEARLDAGLGAEQRGVEALDEALKRLVFGLQPDDDGVEHAER